MIHLKKIAYQKAKNYKIDIEKLKLLNYTAIEKYGDQYQRSFLCVLVEFKIAWRNFKLSIIQKMFKI